MAAQVAATSFTEQETGFLVDEAGNKLQAKSVVMCQMTLFIITAEVTSTTSLGEIWRISTRQMSGTLIFLKGR